MNIHDFLEQTYHKYHKPELISSPPPDPLSFVVSYDKWQDQEVVALIAACFAFGRVEAIRKTVTTILQSIGKDSPANNLKALTQKDLENIFAENFKYRWIDGPGLVRFLSGISLNLKRYGSLKTCFENFSTGRDNTQLPIRISLAAFSHAISGGVYDKNFPLSDPMKGSACKRLFLFLRWMVRKDSVDPGCWEGMADPKNLVIPLDAHVLTFANKNGLTTGNSNTFDVADKVTDFFRQISPEDPVKYDFSLNRLSILEK